MMAQAQSLRYVSRFVEQWMLVQSSLQPTLLFRIEPFTGAEMVWALCSHRFSLLAIETRLKAAGWDFQIHMLGTPT